MAVSTNVRAGAIANRPYILAQSGIPMILPSSGSIGNNGALSGLTALPTTYTSCYMRFPANAIAAGVPAGLYYVVMDTNASGIIYNNTYTSGVPTIPASPTAFVTTGPGAYTQTTGSDITLLSITVPGGAMGIEGELEITPAFQHINNANNKIMKIKYGASGLAISKTRTTSDLMMPYCSIKQMGVSNKQVISYDSPGTFNTSAAGAISYGAQDLSTTFTATLTAQLAVATDYVQVGKSRFVIYPS